jgi:hypothetical protein
VEQVLVGAHDAGAVGRGQPVGRVVGAVGQERVVVEQEQRGDDGRPACARPHGERVLGGEDAVRAALLHEVAVAVLAAQRDGIAAAGPQLVIARHPDHGGEPLPQERQGADHVVDPLGHVAGDDQPVPVVAGAQAVDDRPVLRVPDVEVGHGEEAGSGHRSRSYRPSGSSAG